MRTQLDKDEKLVTIASKHWLSVIFPILATVFFFIFTVYLHTVPKLSNIAVYFLILPLLSGFYSMYAYFDREYNIWAVTDKRVIDEWGIIAKNSKETSLDKIQNITSIQSVAGRIFGFGDLRIQTAATQGSVLYKFVEKPNRLKETILKQQQILQDAKTTEQAEQLAEKMVAAMKEAKDNPSKT